MQANPTSIPPRAQPPVMRDHPYVAAYRCENRESGKLLFSGQMFRDRVGRTRIDYDYGGHLIRIIDDVVNSLAYVVLVNERAFETDKYGEKPSGWSFRLVAPTYTGNTAELLGVQCERVTLTVLPRGALKSRDGGEVWISREQGIVMKEIDPHEGWIWEITTLEFRDPPTGVFDVPAGFINMENGQ